LKAPKNGADVVTIIAHNKIVTQMHWQAINEAEIAAGEPVGKPRRKIVDKQQLLNSAGL
jgi:ferredoxin--NADP+ reductase